MPYLGHPPSTGEDNNFKILDDISSYTLTFDGSSSGVVSAANDTIYSYNHRFVQGQRVTYNNGGGGNINGLTSGSVYFVIKQDHNNIKLATTAARAASGTAEDLSLSGTSGTSHTLNVAFDGVNTKFKATHTTGKKARITRGAQLVLSVNGVIQQPHDSSTPSTGFGFDVDGTIILSQAPASSDVFWGHILTNNNVTFDISDNKIDNFTGNGSTVAFTLSKSPPNNENILVTIDGVVQYPNDSAGNIRAYSVAANILNFTSAPGNLTSIQVRHIGFAGATTGSGGGGVTGVYGRTGNVVLIDTDNITVNDAAITGNATVTGNTTITGDLTVNGTTTTLDTKLTEVDKLEVSANNTTVAVAVTQTGAGDIFNLYDGSTEVFSVADGGNIDANGTLDVAGDVSIADKIVHTGDTNTAIRFPSNDNFTVETGGSERFRINSDGKVGIGTDDPQQRLHVKQGSTTTPAMVEALGAKSHVKFQHNAGNSYTATIGSKTLGANNVGLTFDTGYNGAVQRMTIDVDGNVSIGTGITMSSTTGVITATSFTGSGANLTNLPVTAGLTTDAQNNTIGGFGAGASLQSAAINNTLIGTRCGAAITTEDRNVCIGFEAGKVLTNQQNVCIGGFAGYALETGNANTLLGDQAGYNLTTGQRNIVIGWAAPASAVDVNDEVTIGEVNVTKFRVPGINFVLKDNGGTPSTGQVLTADGSGEGYWATPSAGTTINNNDNNRIITGSGTANTLEGEANLTFDGSQLGLGITPVKPFNIVAGVGTTEFIRLSQPVDASVQQEFGIGWCSNNNHVWPGAQITSLEYDVSDTRRGMLFYTRGTNQDIAPTERMRIAHDGHVAIGGYGDPGSILDVRENKDGVETQIRLFNTDNGDTTTQTAALYLSPDSRGTALAGLRVIKENASFATNAGRDVSLTLNTLQNNAQVEALRITSAGNVSIHSDEYGGGGTAPQLYVVGTGGRQVKIHNTAAGTSMLNITNGTTGQGDDAGTQLFTQGSTGDFWIQSHFATADLVFATKASGASSTEKLRITSDGKIGIGEDDPDGNYLLIRAASTVGTTKGHIMLTGDSATVGQGPQIVFSESGSGSSFAGAYVGHIREGDNSTGALVFGTRATGGDANTVPTEKLRITSTGKIGINEDDLKSRLHIYESANGVKQSVLRLDAHTDTTGDGAFIDFGSRWGGNYPDWVTARIGGIYYTGDGSSGGNRGAIEFMTADNNGSANGGPSGCTTRMVLRPDGDLSLNTGNLVLADTKGISFESTSDPSSPSGMTNELLDDYEEGSWTPTLYAWNGTQDQGYDQQTGNYIKIGNQVHANFYLDLNDKGTVSGNYTFIGGLPYTHAGGVAGGAGTMVAWGWAMGSNIGWIAGDISSTNTVVWISYVPDQNNNTSYMPSSLLYDNSQIKGTLIYRAA